MGSGVVGFNVQPSKAVFCDTNPHLIQFYNDIKSDVLTPVEAQAYLAEENKKLLSGADAHYKFVRDRFNKNPNSLDFLFLNRCCFNGMIRFNNRGGFNVPFCKKANRLAKAYITKISNQIRNVSTLIKMNDYSFVCDSFENVLLNIKANDVIYCDPPYIGRHNDYYNSWDENSEVKLFYTLNGTNAKFILSTWHHNKYRENPYIKTYWGDFNICTKEHFYYLGASEENRNKMIEALITNF
jgi:DNA adenine methylase